MKRPQEGVSFKGRFLGIAVLVVAQFIIGIIHVIFGFAMLSGSFSVATFSMTPLVYGIYTLAYGALTLLFTYLVWVGKRLGWIGTVAVSLAASLKSKASTSMGENRRRTHNAKPVPIIVELRILFIGTPIERSELNFALPIRKATWVPKGAWLIYVVNSAC